MYLKLGGLSHNKSIKFKSMAKKRKTVIAEPLICKSVQYELAILFFHFPPKEFGRLMRDLMIEYLHTNSDIHRDKVDSITSAMSRFNKVIDKAIDEQPERSSGEIFAITKMGKYANLDDDDD